MHKNVYVIPIATWLTIQLIVRYTFFKISCIHHHLHTARVLSLRKRPRTDKDTFLETTAGPATVI